jgi:hypothetical protein
MCEMITYKCGHSVQVTGTCFPAGDGRYLREIQAWRQRLENMPCLACRIENVRSWGYFERMRVIPAARTDE